MVSGGQRKPHQKETAGGTLRQGLVDECALVLGAGGPGARNLTEQTQPGSGLRFVRKNTQKATVLFSVAALLGLSVRPGKSLSRGLLRGEGTSAWPMRTRPASSWASPSLKVSAWSFRLAYIEGGAGIISESINSPALAHAFNFTPQAGAGFDIALTPQLALSVAYRFRHSSNAGIYKENQAFNVNFFQGGLNYYY
jgi:opacity protein-like surface antigen